MRPFFKTCLLWSLSAALCLCIAGCGSGASADPRVIILSYFGLRHDYPDRVETKTLDRLEKEGASAERSLPTFPTNSSTNLAAIATGCYADKHGVVNTRFYDWLLKKIFEGEPEEDKRLLKAEPLWVTARKEGLKTAVINIRDVHRCNLNSYILQILLTDVDHTGNKRVFVLHDLFRSH